MTSATTDLARQEPVGDLDPKRWLALAVIGLAQLMVILDASIVNIALPDAATALHISDANRQWMVTAYALPFGALLLLGGRIADYLGRKRVLMISLLGFAAASALGGAAQVGLDAVRCPGPAGRLCCDAGARGALPVDGHLPRGQGEGFGLCSVRRDRRWWFGRRSAARWFADRVRVVALVPVGEHPDRADFAFFGGTAVLKESKNEARGTHYDVPGAVLGTVGLGLLVWGFTRAANPDLGWTAAQTLLSLGAAVLLLAAFVWRETLSPAPLLPLRILQDRNRSGAYIVGLLVGGGLFAVFLFLTYFLQIVQHYSPIRAGVAFLPFSAGIIVGAGIGSQLVLKIGPRLVVPIGLVMGLIGLLWLSRINLSTTYSGGILPAVIVMSVGMGFIFMSTANVALVGVSKDDAGVASAMVNTAQQVGGSLGTALLSTFALTATTSYLVGHTSELHSAPSKEAAQSIRTAAAVHGYSGSAFIVAASFFALATVASLLLINAGKPQLPAGGA